MSRISTITQSITVNGVHALDLIGEPVKGQDFAKCKAMMEINYGVEFPKEKVNTLFELIAEEGWSSARFQATVKWFLKKQKFATWTIADFFDYGVKLYPYSWYQKQIASGVKHEEMESYLVNGVVLWKMKDGQELPFGRPEPKKAEDVLELETNEAKLLDYPKLDIEDLIKVYDINTKAPVNESNAEYNPRYSKGKEAYEKAREEFEAQVKKELEA